MNKHLLKSWSNPPGRAREAGRDEAHVKRSLPQGLKGCFLPGMAKALMALTCCPGPAQGPTTAQRLPGLRDATRTGPGHLQERALPSPYNKPTEPERALGGEEGFLEGEEVWFRRWALGNDTDSNINKRAKIYYVLTKRQGSY